MSLNKSLSKFIFCLLASFELFAAPRPDLTKEVVDIYNPTIEEFKKIQKCVASTVENLPPQKSNRCRVVLSNSKFVGDSPEQTPIFETVYLNNNPTDKKNCIVLYVTYNSPYPENVSRFVEAIKKVGFDGHLIYRIGGYPNLKNGSLKLMDVPYAFKACALEEARLLGYQNILWVDCSLIPLQSLVPIFRLIEADGYLAIASGSNLQAETNKGHINSQALSAVGISYQESVYATHITTPILGVNTSSQIGRAILKQFCYLAEERNSFFCDWPDELPISSIFYKMRLKPSGIWHRFMVKEGEPDKNHNDHYFRMSLRRPTERTQN